VVKGFDLERGRITVNWGLHEIYEMSLSTFKRTWGRWREDRNLRMGCANLLAPSVSVRPGMGQRQALIDGLLKPFLHIHECCYLNDWRFREHIPEHSGE